MRVLYHIPPFQNQAPRQCLLCHFQRHNLSPNQHFLLCPQNKQITMRFVEKSDQEIQSGKLRCSNPIQSANNFYDLQKYLSTCFYQNVPFTNEEIELIIKKYNKDPPIDPSRNDAPPPKILQSEARKLLQSFNPDHEVIISMDGRSFPPNKNFSKRRAGCCARVFIPGEEKCYENPIFLGDQDSLYAELYSFIASLEVLYSEIAQLKIVPHTTFHFLTDSKEARYLLLSKAQLVLFIRQNLKTILKNFCYKIHWISRSCRNWSS